jgi:hypothetical protein
VHGDLPTDFGYLLPNIVWNEEQEVRNQHLNWSTDICYFMGQWFLRCVLEIPFQFQEGRFGWGIWVQVSDESIENFRSVFEVDGSHCPREQGVIANSIITYPWSMALPVEVQFGLPSDRPKLYFVGNSSHELALKQKTGLSAEEYHEILQVIAPQSVT